jgi:hypothetical protein
LSGDSYAFLTLRYDYFVMAQASLEATLSPLVAVAVTT